MHKRAIYSWNGQPYPVGVKHLDQVMAITRAKLLRYGCDATWKSLMRGGKAYALVADVDGPSLDADEDADVSDIMQIECPRDIVAKYVLVR